TASSITGQPGDIQSLGVNVTSKNGLKAIQWEAPSLLANGGQIIETDTGQYSVKLPIWQATGQNSYTITGRAVDNKGNTSSPSVTQVTVMNENMSSTLTAHIVADPPILPPDGKSRSVLTLTLNDAEGHAVNENINQLKLIVSGEADISISPLNEVSPGVYQATLIAGTKAGHVNIIPEKAGVKIPLKV
uniref:Ig-like domain-containing protein n=1 Tax=Providencia sp. PROV117 TaxID=2949828 RepID=UPI00234AC49F